MSQAGEFGGGGTPLPSLETLTGDAGGAVSSDAAFNINVVGGSDVTTVGDPLTNTITINVSGGYTGTGQTIGAVDADLITVPLGAVPAVYELSVRIAGLEGTTPAGAGYRVNAAARTTGAAGTLIGLNATDSFEEVALNGCLATVVVVGNDAIVRVTGVAGLTVDWSAELNSIVQT